MEKIKIFKGHPAAGRFYIIFGMAFALLGILVTSKNLADGIDLHFPSGDWSFIFFVFQGILFAIMGWSMLKSRKYFIQWDEKELQYLLPSAKKTETIHFKDIESVNIRLFEILLTLKNGTKTINLENLEFEDIRKVKEKFQEWLPASSPGHLPRGSL